MLHCFHTLVIHGSCIDRHRLRRLPLAAMSLMQLMQRPPKRSLTVCLLLSSKLPGRHKAAPPRTAVSRCTSMPGQL